MNPPHNAFHSPDYRSVYWFGTAYSFTSMQAIVVGSLWAAALNHTPEIGLQSLLETCESAQNRLDSLFAGHPAWGAMIVAGKTKGTYRLAVPEDAIRPLRLQQI